MHGAFLKPIDAKKGDELEIRYMRLPHGNAPSNRFPRNDFLLFYECGRGFVRIGALIIDVSWVCVMLVEIQGSCC